MVRLIILRLTESFFRNRGLYQLPVVLMIVLAGLYVLFSPRVYISGGTLYVQQDSLLSSLANMGGSGSWWVTPAQASVNEFNELLGTDAFVRSILAKTDLERELERNPHLAGDMVWELRQSISFYAQGENLVSFGGSFGDPVIARQIAQASIDTYLQWKLNADQRESIVAQDFFASQLVPFQQELDQAQIELRGFLAAHPEPVRGDRPADEQLLFDQIQRRVSQAIGRIENAQNRIDEAQLAQSIAESEVYQNYRVVDAPGLPSRPTLGLSGALTSIILFVVVGVFLSCAGVAGGAILDRTMRFPLDVRHSLELPVLAMIPDTRVSSSLRWLPWRGREKRPAALRPLVPNEPTPAGDRPLGESDERPLRIEDLIRSFQAATPEGDENAQASLHLSAEHEVALDGPHGVSGKRRG